MEGLIMAKDVSQTVRVSRLGISFGVLVQSLCIVFLVGAANYIGFNYYKRWDFSRSQKFSLADQSEQVLRQLEPTMKVIVYFSPNSMGPDSLIYGDVKNLLAQFAFSGRRKIDVREIDPSRDVATARELQEQYKFDGTQNLLILDYQGRSKLIPIMDMAEFDFSGVPSGEAPQLVTFNGEAALTSAFIELMSPKKARVYFVNGHGETLPAKLTTLGDAFQRQNIVAPGLNLGTVDRVPADADAVCIVGPHYDFTDAEINLLNKYWNAQGRIVILLDPNTNLPNFRQFVNDVGIWARNDRVQRLAASTTQATFGILRSMVRGVFLPASPITKRLVNTNALLIGPTQSLWLDDAGAARDDIQLIPLIQASEEYWGERHYAEDSGAGVIYNDGEDTGAPIVLAASAEKGAAKDQRTDVAVSRMVVVGNCGFVEDEALRQAPANLDFMLSVLNRMIEGRSKLTGITPQSAKSFSLSLTDAQIRNIALYTLIIIPACAALMGLIVGLRRRA
ncbi:MAG: Gldg family protein [Chthoniobacterales bacterium]